MCGALVGGIAALSEFCGSDCATAIGPLVGASQPRQERRRTRVTEKGKKCTGCLIGTMTSSSGMTHHRLRRGGGIAGRRATVQKFIEIARVDVSGEKLWVVQNLLMQSDIRLYAADLILTQSPAHTLNGLLTRTTRGNHLGD